MMTLKMTMMMMMKKVLMMVGDDEDYDHEKDGDADDNDDGGGDGDDHLESRPGHSCGLPTPPSPELLLKVMQRLQVNPSQLIPFEIFTWSQIKSNDKEMQSRQSPARTPSLAFITVAIHSSPFSGLKFFAISCLQDFPTPPLPPPCHPQPGCLSSFKHQFHQY